MTVAEQNQVDEEKYERQVKKYMEMMK